MNRKTIAITKIVEVIMMNEKQTEDKPVDQFTVFHLLYGLIIAIIFGYISTSIDVQRAFFTGFIILVPLVYLFRVILYLTYNKGVFRKKPTIVKQKNSSTDAAIAILAYIVGFFIIRMIMIP